MPVLPSELNLAQIEENFFHFLCVYMLIAIFSQNVHSLSGSTSATRSIRGQQTGTGFHCNSISLVRSLSISYQPWLSSSSFPPASSPTSRAGNTQYLSTMPLSHSRQSVSPSPMCCRSKLFFKLSLFSSSFLFLFIAIKIGFGDYVPTFQPHQERTFGVYFTLYQIFILVWFIAGELERLHRACKCLRHVRHLFYHGKYGCTRLPCLLCMLCYKVMMMEKKASEQIGAGLITNARRALKFSNHGTTRNSNFLFFCSSVHTFHPISFPFFPLPGVGYLFMIIGFLIK